MRSVSERFLRRVRHLAVALLVVHVSAHANEVVSTVTVNSERLPIKLREEVAGFADEFERYVNRTKWTADEWKGTPIELNFSVAFTFGNEDGDFRASLLVISQRDVYKSAESTPMFRVLDEKWNFRYVRNQQFRQDVVGYDPVTSVIDFYVYTALGLDLDTYGYLGGKRMYERAVRIAQRGEVDGGADGWSRDEPAGSFSRQNFIRELTNPRFFPIRKFLLNYHYNGIDRLSEFPEAALDSLNAYVTDLAQIKNNLVASSTLIRVINDTKHQEFATLFTGYHDPRIWDKLLFIDPTHQTVYEEAKRRS